MLHLDYNWDLRPDRIILDEELNIDRLGWQGGDIFRLENHNGQVMLVKLNPLVALVEEHKNEINKNS